ncbi:DUF1285 domain-containing protein [Salinicola aestuarinus]|uniref:DUF1285 domain-containing protein n=1 Tax=Salinicola aestuarinus TaxID=1949082 RepID=UPI000DA1C6DA|nr:DUF1285 domain-containing protein [Salinicola aestuarinus]
MRLDALFQQVKAEARVPIERWDPPVCGEMDLVITQSGDWIHEGSPITRPELVQLLARVLRRESDGDYYLVTPGEKLRIRVEDLPLSIHDAEADAAGWTLVGQWGEQLRLDASRRLMLVASPSGDPLPAVAVDRGLWARLHRNLFYRLVECADVEGSEIGLWSDGAWQSLGRLDVDA